MVDGREIQLSSIKKQKNDDLVEEAWVQCSGCNKWQHQICALFNHRRHDQSPSRTYYCPRCLLHELNFAAQRNLIVPQPRMKRAADLDQVRVW
jgi:E1A/CREB-binding protein